MLVSKAALAATAAVSLFIPMLATPLPDACAAPSPSCGGDLRECLRAAADMRQTTFGGRYVTADDVSRCMEAFNSCISGGASRGGNPVVPPTKSQRDGGAKVMPQRFSVDGEVLMDCQVNGSAVSCTLSQKELAETWASYTGDLTGTLSGMTVTGTRSEQFTSKTNSGCYGTQFHSGPVSMVFNPDGSGSLRAGPIEVKGTYQGSCSSVPTESWTIPAYEAPFGWSS